MKNLILIVAFLFALTVNSQGYVKPKADASLQEVTDVGNTTNKGITLQNSSPLQVFSDLIGATSNSKLGVSGLTVYTGGAGSDAKGTFEDDKFTFTDALSNELSIRKPLVQTGDFIQYLQDKAGTIALLSDIGGGGTIPTLQEVTTAGNTTTDFIQSTNSLEAYTSTFLRTSIGQGFVDAYGGSSLKRVIMSALLGNIQVGNGSTFRTTLQFPNATVNRTINLQDGDGTLAFLSDITGDYVSKVGTPVDNQIGVWTGDGTIEGTPGLTWTGSILNLSAGASIRNAGTTGFNLRSNGNLIFDTANQNTNYIRITGANNPKDAQEDGIQVATIGKSFSEQTPTDGLNYQTKTLTLNSVVDLDAMTGDSYHTSLYINPTYNDTGIEHYAIRSERGNVEIKNGDVSIVGATANSVLKHNRVTFYTGAVGSVGGASYSDESITFTEQSTSGVLSVLKPATIASGLKTQEFQDKSGTIALLSDIVAVNELLQITPSSTPATASEGDVYFDSTTKKLRCFDGSAWHNLF